MSMKPGHNMEERRGSVGDTLYISTFNGRDYSNIKIKGVP
jgi:hypothetical protein